MKILLAAIAKDESAYISNWILHHLNYGFDAVEIYTNGITDSTEKTLDKFVKNCLIKLTTPTVII